MQTNSAAKKIMKFCDEKADSSLTFSLAEEIKRCSECRTFLSEVQNCLIGSSMKEGKRESAKEVDKIVSRIVNDYCESSG